MEKLLIICLLFVGCTTNTRVAKIEKMNAEYRIYVSYQPTPLGDEVTQVFRTHDKDFQDLRPGDYIKVNDWGYVGKVKIEK